MKVFTIYRQYFTNADCYKQKTIQEPKGIQVHSTGANNPYLKRYVQPDDGRLGQNKYNNSHNRSGLNVCANAYIGKLEDNTVAIYQTLPWNYRCWLSGSSTKGNANKLGYIGFEICEDGLNDKNYFEAAVMQLSVYLDAYLCLKFNIPVNMIHDHSELHDMGLASNHGDIHHWLKKFNVTMDEYRNAVSAAIHEGVQVTYVENQTSWTETLQDSTSDEEDIVPIYQAKVITSNGGVVNLRESPTTDSAVLKKVPTNAIVDVIKELGTEWNQIQYENTVGYMMKKFLSPISPPTETEITISYQQLLDLKKQLVDTLELINSFLNL